MAKQLKSTGMAARAVMLIMVDPDTGTIKDFASSTVTSTMQVGANVTVGDLTWDGVTQKYFRNGSGTTDADFIKFVTNKPSFTLGAGSTQFTLVALAQAEDATTRVMGTGSQDYFFSRDSGTGGATYPRLWIASNSFTGALSAIAVGAKKLFGFNINRGGSGGWFEASDTDESINSGSLSFNAIDRTWTLDYVGRRNDSTSNTRGYFVAIGIFTGNATSEELGALRDDPAGYLLETAGGGGGATADGVTITATASLTAGSASGVSNATAGGVTLTATASLISGSASAGGSATADGVTLTATASLIAGSASGVINGVLNFQAAGLEFGGRTGLGIDTFALDNGVSYRYTVHADELTLGAAILTSAAITLDSAGKLPNLVSASLTPGTNYRVVAVRQTDGEAAIFRLTAS